MKKLYLVVPFLWAVYPILSLFAANSNKVFPSETLRALAIATAGTLALLILLMQVLRSENKAVVVLSVFWLLFYAFGHALSALGGPGQRRGVYLPTVWVAVFVVLAWLVVRARSELRAPITVLAAMGAALTGMSLVLIAASLIHQPRVVAVAPSESVARGSTARKPDIWYIILDGYARADVLEDYYQYDNSDFVSGLVERGFYVAEQSSANYGQTHLSLASSLNFDYLDALASQVGTGCRDRGPLRDMIAHNRVAAVLASQGYEYVSLSSGYLDSELRQADKYLSRGWSPNVFESELLSLTPAAALPSLQYAPHRQRLLYAFEHLPDAAALEQPTFVFAHVLAPHHPFVFDENGASCQPDRVFSYADDVYFMKHPSERGEYADSYRRQLAFVSDAILETIDRILGESASPPVIILQSDHGPGLDWGDPTVTDRRERMSILNAYYVPSEWRKLLYESITPVNTFRIVLNQCAGTDYPLLEDASYFATWDRPYDYVPVSVK